MRLIRLSSLSDGMVLARDLRTGRPGEIALLRAGVRLSGAYVERLRALGVHTVWIDDELSRGIEPLPALAPEERVAAEVAVSESFDRTARTLAKGGTAMPRQDLEQLTSTVARIAASLADVPEATLALGDLATADAYTHRHSVQVALIGMLIARRHLVPRRLARLDGAPAPRRHRGAPDEARRRPDPARHRQARRPARDHQQARPAGRRGVRRDHPEAGVDLLRAADPSPLTVATVRDHHERLDGSGYPARRTGNSIHEFARICAIADVFDAVSSERPYKHAAPPHVGVNVIGEGVARGIFDAAVARALRRVCMPYPIGTDLVVDGEWLGVVSAVDAEEPWMPTVRRMQGAEVEELTLDLRHLDALRAPGAAALEAA